MEFRAHMRINELNTPQHKSQHHKSGKYEVRTQCLGSRNKSWQGITGESGHVFYLDISMHGVRLSHLRYWSGVYSTLRIIMC
jgi:hypothetical protein